MKALIVGAAGQLGRELQRTCPSGVELVTLGREQLDIGNPEAVISTVTACGPQIIFNAAAYTAIDGAESEPDLAVAINAEGPGALARAAERCKARLLHVSTDLVFDGAASEPYKPNAEPRPLGVYGHSKLAGECRVREILPLDSVVLRTARLYSRFGSNVVKTMLREMSDRESLSMVDDQLGTPTWANGLAQVLWAFLGHPTAHGIYHWTDAGRCSWLEFARETQARALALGLLNRRIDIAAVSTADQPTPARRPAFSVLDLTGTEALLERRAAPWQDQLQRMLEELKEE